MAQIISVFSTKGGVGRTFVATNLSIALAKKLPRNKKVLLVDTDLQSPGHMAILLNLKPKKPLVGLVPDWKKGSYTPSQISEYIIHSPFAGIDLLPVILTVEDRPNVDEKFISCVLSDLSKKYEYIICDSGRAYNNVLVMILERTNLILLVINPDVLSVYQAKEEIKILQLLYFPTSMMRVILNRAESTGAVTWQEVRVALPCDIICRIPSEGRIVGSALNRGIPVVLDSPRSRASMMLNKLAEDLIAQPDLFTSHIKLDAAILAIENKKTFLDERASSLEALSLGGRKFIEKKLSKEEKIDELKQRVHRRVIQELDLRRLDRVAGDPEKIKDLRLKIILAANIALADETGSLISSREEREALIKEIADETLGLGPLEDLINDPQVTDILVNNKSQIYVERYGKLEQVTKRFVSNDQVRQIIERIIAPLGRRVDESVPMVDGRLADGSRVNAIIPPLSLTGPTLTIRKFSQERLKINNLVQLNALNDVMGNFLRACVLMRKNIIVSGGTGSGKTTVLNVLSEFVPEGERVITIEDAAELKLDHQHWIRLESRPPNIEGKGAIFVRDLFRNSLRMRPDRIIIGECRGEETMDMLQAMNTGHDGSMTTIHANSTQDVLVRLDSLILMSGIEIPLRAIREMIASSIDMIVHTARLSDGSRKVTQITEITGMVDEVHIGLSDLFVFRQSGVDDRGIIQGEYGPTGNMPTFFNDLIKSGIILSEDIFKIKT
ncbi:MAG: ATPase, T2SS/T4P/T4SS family [Candidatus Omnitrophota bacterium]